ncbi:MAG TPA: lysophospholipid acyltransferase family protein [Candidatus Binataceae bacterium]|nr:lysophospholipid acyltransferase family protein [Candidatus Binataceae bacterium]
MPSADTSGPGAAIPASRAAAGAHDAQGTGSPGAAAATGLELRGLPRARTIRYARLELSVRERIVYWLFVAVLHAFSLIPDFILLRLGALGGFIGFYLDGRHVRIGMKNLAVAFPNRSVAERRRILRESYINLGRSGAEYIRLGGFFRARLARRVRYENLEYWNQIADRYPGKGLLVMSAHFGNFELIAAAHSMHGYQISLVHHMQSFLPGEAMVTFVRERAGVELIRKHSAARAVLRALKAGDVIAIPFDQNAKRSEAVFVPFFGELAATTSGLARLAMISGAPVVPAFIVRDPNHRTHRIEIMEQVPVQRTGDTDADVLENTRRFVGAVEDVVRRYPEQFLWTHRRFRTRPRGAPPIYDWNTHATRRSDRPAASPG